jgi:hypothetical protein
MDLAEALNQFDRAEANLTKAEATWLEMGVLIPDGITFIAGSPDSTKYGQLARELDELVGSLPKIDSHQVHFETPDPDSVAQARYDANEIGEVSILIDLQRQLEAPTEALAEYRHRLDRARRKLVRDQARNRFLEIDRLLEELTAEFPRDSTALADETKWQELVATIAEAERLVGASVTRTGRWGDLRRHIGFALGVDLHDIADHDWPSVRKDLESALYADREPLEIDVDDLGSLADQQPEGRVSAALNWAGIDEEAFERLVFDLISSSEGYENPAWLTRTNAPDRSRDLSVDRVIRDNLAGTIRQRVIIQCKHWQSRSVALPDVTAAVAAMALWDSPPVDVLVIATSGRFTNDAIAWIETHNHDGTRPRVEMWADSHFELLLAERPALASNFGLHQ